MCPTNALALAKLAVLSAGRPGDTNANPVEADFLSRRALVFGPQQAEVWQARAEVLERFGKPGEGLEAVEKALSLKAEDLAMWETKARLLEVGTKWEEAAAAYGHLAELLGRGGATNWVACRQALLSRVRMLIHLGRAEEAQRERLRAINIPDRTAAASPAMLDLSSHYNASFEDDWHNPADAGNNLAALPKGMQELGGVRFDVRGIVQLNSLEISKAGFDYPSEVPGIGVNQTAAKVHFLHGCGWPGEEDAVVAHYLVHYADGGSESVPVVYGRDIRNWQFGPEMAEREKAGGLLAWQGPKKRWEQHYPQRGVRLYRMTWDNPHPEKKIATIDLVSEMTPTAVFVIAITVE